MNQQRLEEINQRLKRQINNIIYDGVTNYGIFKETNPKILWILKEPNDRSQASWDLREFHKNVTKYRLWRRTYKLIIKITYALLNDVQEYKDVPEESKISDDLHKIALINIKKIGGNSRANQKTINSFYAKYKDDIFEQIDSIDPDIIINCSRVSSLFKDLIDSDREDVGKFEVGKQGKRTIINAYHPNAIIKHKLYFDLIIKCIDRSGSL